MCLNWEVRPGQWLEVAMNREQLFHNVLMTVRFFFFFFLLSVYRIKTPFFWLKKVLK